MTRPGAAFSAERSERVLVLVRGPHDAGLTRELLTRAGFEALVCASVNELEEKIREGAAAALLEEEVLTESGSVERLARTLGHQPAWSDFPIVVFSAIGDGTGRGAEDIARLLGNVTFLDRPVRTRSMLASVHASIRSRRRQYEARRAIQDRDTFLAMLGHELRNPLGAIHLAIGLLQKKTPEASRSREFGVIERQVRHVTRLVDDLLDVARIMHGKVVLKSERLNLAEVARSAFDAQETRARDQGLSYDFRAPQGAVWTEGDRQRLEQVFANLITNAIKYTPRGGAITLTVCDEGEEAVVVVTDTGVGIPPGMVSRLFEAFAQADRTLDRTEGGIGLGLALVRNLVQLHGGTAEGASEGPNRGSSFVVRLPASKGDVPAAPGSGVTLDEHSPAKRILVVEDSPDIREMLATLLALDGHEVACAEDGPRGLEKLLTLSPDIALIDLGLPGFDGLELARRARASGLRTTLVAVTGYGRPEDRTHAIDAGFDDHLTKPVGDVDLHRMMRRLGRLEAPAHRTG